MADTIISVVLERITAIAEEEIRSEVDFVRGLKKEVRELSDRLKTVRDVLDDAEKRGVKEESVRGWLMKLEDAAYEIDDILDELNFYGVDASATKKVCRSFKQFSLQNVKESLDQILKEKDEFNFVISNMPITDSAPRVRFTSSIDLEKVHGQDVDRNKNDIVRKLIDGERQIVSIVGIGGIGKTTLVQLVYDDSRVKDYFESTIWIHVSDPFDVASIASGIVEIEENDSGPNTNSLEVILQQLRDSISGKKFLLVLDDVWTHDYGEWERLKVNLQYGAPSSKILVTTRNEGVAKMMGTFEDEICRPELLTDEESWSLLHRISLPERNTEECGEFEQVGKKIARKCKGLPLALNILGGVLLFKNSLEEWEDVLESEIWELNEVELELYPHLLLSYNELSPALRRCFSYCAVYPKDSRIEVETLIGQWMALGYLGSVSGNPKVELKGREYFNNLAMHSLFQHFEKSGPDNEIRWCKMHDIVHDFAGFLRKNGGMDIASQMTKGTCQFCEPFLVSHSQKYRSLFWDKGSPPNLCDCRTNFRVLGFKFGLNASPQEMEKLIHLRWLDISRTKLSTKEDLKTICKLHFLQTLNLAFCSLEKIPGEIGNLINLRQLDLSWNFELKELPEIFCRFVELQTLNIKFCQHLHKLPEGLAQISGLCSLDWFHGGTGYNKFGLLKNLNSLSGSLDIFVMVGSSSCQAIDPKELVEDAREAELWKKTHLHKIMFQFIDEGHVLESSSSSSSMGLEVIEALEPHQNLQFLEICGYRASRLPHWISSRLNLVKKIELYHCPELSSLPPIGKLPFLEELNMRGMKNMKALGVKWLGIRSEGEVTDTESSSSIVSFPKLKELGFYDWPGWLEWEDITAEEEESTTVLVMPCLKHLVLMSCDDLKFLPDRLLRKVSTLQLLDIRYSSQLIQCYGDKDGSPWKSICVNNPQLVLFSGST